MYITSDFFCRLLDEGGMAYLLQDNGDGRCEVLNELWREYSELSSITHQTYLRRSMPQTTPACPQLLFAQSRPSKRGRWLSPHSFVGLECLAPHILHATNPFINCAIKKFVFIFRICFIVDQVMSLSIVFFFQNSWKIVIYNLYLT